nr:hypothetical protein BaRGS_011746 [Batillaria attramentaria]
MKFIKFFAYIFFFIIVLVSATAQKVSFMLMVSALNTTIQTGMPAKEIELKKAEKSAYYILAVVAVCLPYLLNFISSLAKVMFGAFRSPSPTTWIWANGRPDKTRSHCIVNAMLDFFAFVGQMSVFPVIFVLGYIDYDESDILTMVDIVGALVFVSCSHWENFMDGRFFVTLKDGNWWKQLMLKRRFEMDRGRYITVLVTSVWKILATIGLAYLFRGDRDQDYQSALDTLLDWEQFMRQKAEEIAGTEDPDFFNYEAHVFFDDAMTLDDDEEFIPNSYVTLLVEVMEEAVGSVHKKTISVKPPLKIPTPYGGQLVWVMPGGNLLFVHMKDKAKIRHRKRWSQVMYMYYLLGFRLTRLCEEQIMEALRSGGVDHHKGWKLNEESEIFELLDENVARMRHQILYDLDRLAT